MKAFLLLSVAAWLLAATVSAQAAVTRCVSTSGELASAIHLAETQAVTIKVVQGNYDMDVNDWGTGPYPVFVRAGSSLRGGYTGDACTGRDIAANNTVLHIGTGYLVQADVTGDFTMEGVTWSGGQIVEFDLDDSLVMYSANPQILIHRCVFDNVQFGFQWSIGKSLGGSLRIDDTLIYGLNYTPGIPSLFAYVEKGAPDVSLINDSVVNGFNGGGAALGNNAGGSHGAATFRVYNSIFYGNNGIDLDADTDALVLVDNVIGTHHYPTPNTVPVGTLTGDPQLDSSYRPIESPASPVINSGTSKVFGGLPSTDLPGRNRVVGSKPDRGAYESLVDDGSIQTVINTNNSGSGSLRQAIINANATGGFVVIEFNIDAACPQTIVLASALPDITGRVWIDGYTQPGSALNDLDPGDDAVLCIILDGKAHAVANGLHVARSAPATATLFATGLAFSGFSSAGILLGGGSSDHFVSGNQFGGIVGFNYLNQVANGIVIGAGVSNVLIGGSDPANRNLVQLATNDGIILDGASGSIDASHDVQIINNYIGVGWNPSGSFTNDANASKGILISGYNNTVSGNVLSYNGGDGVDIDGGYGNSIESNFIGTSPLFDNLGNVSMGVRVENDAHDNTIHLNTIAYNKQKGVRVVSGTGNRISQNNFHDNALLGIDLAGEGVTPNDDDATPPTPDYANRGQNFPVIDSAIGGHSNGTMTGSLTTVPGTYTLEVFGAVACDASGYGEGEVFMGSASIDVPADSGDQGTTQWSFALTFPRTFTLLPYVSATVTDGAGNTSEFSNCFPYTDDTIFADDFDPDLIF